MSGEDEVEGETAIEVGPPEDGRPVTPDPPRGGATRSARSAVDIPFDTFKRVKGRYRGLDNKDKFVVLVGVLVIVIAISVFSIYLSAGGIGPDDGGSGPEIVNNWRFGAQQTSSISGDEENTNLEGQETPYPVYFQPNRSEVYMITKITGHVQWTDESSPPAQVPAYGYNTNEPDSFQLIFRVHDDLGEWTSDLVFNPQGQPGDLLYELELPDPIYVANPQGADYLPAGYVETVRIDIIVRTEDCGDWPPPDPLRPTIGDGGNHYTFEWSVEYFFDDDGKP